MSVREGTAVSDWVSLDVPPSHRRRANPYLSQGRDRAGPAGVLVPGDEAAAAAAGASDAVAALPAAALPFADSGNPILSQVAFLSAVVGPKVAAAAAQAALNALCSEVPVVDADVRFSISLPLPLFRRGVIARASA